MAIKAGAYQLAVGDGEIELTQEVNQLIAQNWQPLGGPITFRRDNGTLALMQAMIKSAAPSP